jgi:hypothetical protein
MNSNRKRGQLNVNSVRNKKLDSLGKGILPHSDYTCNTLYSTKKGVIAYETAQMVPNTAIIPCSENCARKTPEATGSCSPGH